MPSPKPERNKSDGKAIGVYRARQEHYTQSPRDTQPLRVNLAYTNPDNANHHDYHEAAERFVVTKLALSIVLTVATVGAFAAATYYACQAKKQVAESIKANGIAHENAVKELRAYVNLGGPQSDPAKISFSHPTADITVNFFNAGRTPAKHFAAVLFSNLKASAPVQFRQRVRDLNSGIIETAQMELFDNTIPAGATYTEHLGKQWLPPMSLLYNVRPNSSKLLVVAGYFEYCDIFGTYYCESFGYKYVPWQKPEWTGWMSPQCHATPTVLPDQTMGLFGKPTNWIAMLRCEQEEEMKQDQGGDGIKRPHK